MPCRTPSSVGSRAARSSSSPRGRRVGGAGHADRRSDRHRSARREARSRTAKAYWSSPPATSTAKLQAGSSESSATSTPPASVPAMRSNSTLIGSSSTRRLDRSRSLRPGGALGRRTRPLSPTRFMSPKRRSSTNWRSIRNMPAIRRTLNAPAAVQRPAGVLNAATIWIESDNLQSILIQNTGTD